MGGFQVEVAPGVPRMSQDACDQPCDESGEVDGQGLSEDLDFHSGSLFLDFGVEEVELLWVCFPYEPRSDYREGVYKDVDSDQNEIIVNGSEAVCGAVD